MIRKHSATIKGHRTSFSLEDPFWDALKMIAAQRRLPVSRLVEEIDASRRQDQPLSSSIRVHILAWFMSGQNGEDRQRACS